MYKMISNSREDGTQFLAQFSNNIEYFEKFKHKVNYRIEIYKLVKKRYKLIYREP